MFKNGQVRPRRRRFSPARTPTTSRNATRRGKSPAKLVPQGILCERMRAAAAGLLGFYTTVGVGTEVANGKEERVIDGKRCILEKAHARGFRSDQGGEGR